MDKRGEVSMTFNFKVKLIDDNFLDKDGKILHEYKFKINHPTLKIQNSKFIGKPEDKFETMLFLPEGEGRKGEGGLRTKGYFKFSYVWNGGSWWITDLEGNPVMPAPEEIQKSINEYLNTLSSKNNPIQTENSAANQYPTLNKLPLITVITVVFNGEKYLEQTIQSVINQTYPNVEYIIIDGGSTDGTLDIIKKYEDYIDYWVSEKDKGIYDAMNKGVICSLGAYLNFMNSGDQFFIYTNIENIIMSLANKIEEIGIIYGSVLHYGDPDDEYIYIAPSLKLKDNIILYMPSYHQSIFYKRNNFMKLGLYDTNFKISSDYELTLRFISSGVKVFRINEIISKFLSNGISQSNYLSLLLEYFIIRRKYATRISLKIYCIHLFILEIIKFLLRKLIGRKLIKILRMIFLKSKFKY